MKAALELLAVTSQILANLLWVGIGIYAIYLYAKNQEDADA